MEGPFSFKTLLLADCKDMHLKMSPEYFHSLVLSLKVDFAKGEQMDLWAAGFQSSFNDTHKSQLAPKSYIPKLLTTTTAIV